LDAAPLLSILIPAYNGAQYLRVTLEALLPQVLQAGRRVEALVIDDASPDGTADVVQKAQRYGPARYIRNESNLGLNRNTVNAVLTHASGEFVWAWNQHCLIYPGALVQLLDVLAQHRDLDALYVNFRCASYPRDWPEEAVGGYAGPYDYVANAELQSRPIERWEDLLDAESSVCTQSYAHIVRRSVWIKYWEGRTLGRDLVHAHECYPHTCTVAEQMFGRPSYYVGQPVITIYNGAQSWGALKSRAAVCLRGYPDLLRLYKRLGWSGAKLREAQAWGAVRAGMVMHELFREWRPEHGRLISAYLMQYGYQEGVLWAAWSAFVESKCCWTARGVGDLRDKIRAAFQYCFRRCRPARWVRAHLGKS
jgi:hypothetical protein